MRIREGDPAVLYIGGRWSPSLGVSEDGGLTISRPDFRKLVESLEGKYTILCVDEGGVARPFLFADKTILFEIHDFGGRGTHGQSTIDPCRPVPRHFGLTAESLVTGGVTEVEEFRYCLFRRVGLTAYRILYATTNLSDVEFVKRYLCGTSAFVATIEGGPLRLV